MTLRCARAWLSVLIIGAWSLVTTAAHAQSLTLSYELTLRTVEPLDASISGASAQGKDLSPVVEIDGNVARRFSWDARSVLRTDSVMATLWDAHTYVPSVALPAAPLRVEDNKVSRTPPTDRPLVGLASSVAVWNDVAARRAFGPADPVYDAWAQKIQNMTGAAVVFPFR